MRMQNIDRRREHTLHREKPQLASNYCFHRKFSRFLVRFDLPRYDRAA
jgi:hypothetical protein